LIHKDREECALESFDWSWTGCHVRRQHRGKNGANQGVGACMAERVGQDSLIKQQVQCDRDEYNRPKSHRTRHGRERREVVVREDALKTAKNQARLIVVGVSVGVDFELRDGLGLHLRCPSCESVFNSAEIRELFLEDLDHDRCNLSFMFGSNANGPSFAEYITSTLTLLSTLKMCLLEPGPGLGGDCAEDEGCGGESGAWRTGPVVVRVVVVVGPVVMVVVVDPAVGALQEDLHLSEPPVCTGIQ